MRITISVVPRARRTSVEPLADGAFRVTVTPPAHDGKANDAVVDALADYFQVSRSKVQIVRGRTSRRKVVQIERNV